MGHNVSYNIGRAIIYNLLISKIKIHRVFTTSCIYSICVPNLLSSIPVFDIYSYAPSSDVPLLLCGTSIFKQYMVKLMKTTSSKFFLDYVLSCTMTKTFFPKLDSGSVIAVQCYSFIRSSLAVPLSQVTLANERRFSFNDTNFSCRKMLIEKIMICSRII